STIQLQKLSPNWNPTDRNSAMNRLQTAKTNGGVLTGLIYIDPSSTELHDLMGTTDKPLNKMKKEELCPGNEALEVINQSFR
ncbi:MAG: 2-oxoglutarate ferredoxin oxidoreductase subunit beta, partial [Nonlabens sp.]